MGVQPTAYLGWGVGGGAGQGGGCVGYWGGGMYTSGPAGAGTLVPGGS